MSSTTPDDPPSPSREHDDRITEMLSILALPQAEREIAATRFCAEHPEHAEGLRCMLSEARAAGQDPAVSPARPSTPATAERLQRLAARAQPAEERYRLEGEVGRGGMGAVLRAWDHDLGRPLAMKVILGKGVEPSGATPSVDADVLQRFLDEAQITGQLDHPGVVPVHELGVDSNGRVYFTMRLVKGQTAEEVFKLAHDGRDGWSITRALEVILKVCDTLAYAHRKGVIHRDLKPSNVMVGRFGEVYVMDWGLAKVLGQADQRDLRIRPENTTSRSRVRTDRSQEAESDPDSPLLTMDGAVVGTPCYMSPEQARGEVERLGERSDVYAVGAMLYTLLTGRQPYLEPGQKASPYAILRWVLDGPPAPLRKLAREVPAELVAICDKAMARDIEQRYASASELAEDLRAYLERRVVRAYRTGAWAEARAWIKRNRGVAASLVAAAMASVAGTIVSVTYAQRANASAASERATAQLAKDREQEAIVSKQEAIASAQEAQRRTVEARQQTYFASIAAVWAACERSAPANLRRMLDQAPAELRGWEWRYLDSQSDASLLVLRGHERPVCTAVFSPDGVRIVTSSEDGTARLWEATTGTLLAILRGHAEPGIFDAFSFYSGELLVAGNTFRRGIDVAPADLEPPKGFASADCAFNPDSTRVVTVAGDATARVWDATTGTELAPLKGHKNRVWSAAFSADGSRIVTASADKTARVWDAKSGNQLAVLRGHEADVWCAVISPDGTRVVTTSQDQTARVWDPMAEAELAVLRGHAGDVWSAAFDRDGARVVTTSWDRTARVWDVATGAQLQELGHERAVCYAAFGPDGTQIITVCRDKTARVWNAKSGASIAVLRHSEEVRSAAFSLEGTRIVTTCADALVRVWEPGSDTAPAVLRGHEDGVRSVAFSPDGARIVTASDDGTARVWSANTRQDRAIHLGDNGAVTASFLTGSDRVLVVSRDATGRVWDATTGQGIAVLRGYAGDMSSSIPGGHSAILSAHGELLLMAGPDATLRTVNAITGAETAALSRSYPPFAISCDGTRIASSSSASFTRLQVCDANTNARLCVLRMRRGSVARSVAFNVDATRLVTASIHCIAQVWDATTGNELATLRGHTAAVSFAAFSPDDTRVATTSDDKTARLWDARTGVGLAILRGHTETISHVAFSPDGTRLVTASDDNTARVWDAASGTELAILRGQDDVVQVAFSANGIAILTLTRLGATMVWDSSSYRVRLTERRAYAAAEHEGMLTVASALEGTVAPAKAAEAILANELLDPLVRRVAFDRLLQAAGAAQDQAWTLISRLRKRLGFVSDVVAAVESEPSLSSVVRTEALRMARGLVDDPDHLSGLAWRLVRKKGVSDEEARRALQLATRATQLRGEWRWNTANTLGVAQYRCGEYVESRRTLLRSLQVGSASGHADDPRDLTFLAMSEHQLGNHDEARKLLAKLEGVMSQRLGDQPANERVLRFDELQRWLAAGEQGLPPSAQAIAPQPPGDEDARGFLAEARSLIAGK